jgi:Mn-dependent DtxR family transcriptional regulator
MLRFSFIDMVVERLAALPNNNGIIRFPNVFYKLCSSLQIDKNTAWLILMDLEKDGLIEIVANNGIRLISNS